MPSSGPVTPINPTGSVQLVSPITPAVGQAWQVEVDNISPWPIMVNVSGQTYSQGPGVAHLYPARSGPADVQVTGREPAGTDPNPAYYLLTNWAQAPDMIPGTFPTVIAPSPQNLDQLATLLSQMVEILGEMNGKMTSP